MTRMVGSSESSAMFRAGRAGASFCTAHEAEVCRRTKTVPDKPSCDSIHKEQGGCCAPCLFPGLVVQAPKAHYRPGRSLR